MFMHTHIYLFIRHCDYEKQTPEHRRRRTPDILTLISKMQFNLNAHSSRDHKALDVELEI
jgi:hypothetical protein